MPAAGGKEMAVQGMGIVAMWLGSTRDGHSGHVARQYKGWA